MYFNKMVIIRLFTVSLLLMRVDDGYLLFVELPVEGCFPLIFSRIIASY